MQLNAIVPTKLQLVKFSKLSKEQKIISPLSLYGQVVNSKSSGLILKSPKSSDPKGLMTCPEFSLGGENIRATVGIQ
ncbi:uncharacterized protein N7479_003667 [Penicillium vulpinum]|uniref:uncharacterized protein n=1 Tax=Penicillium vulpinum TaxID=29845 RepID=UPI002547227E|nr:uncharacterized protein N7479_003667 [Penicillium vulpinum]KAJ5963791.1 hypothetical protein N7479_003667 [Penicillium vulpinum]